MARRRQRRRRASPRGPGVHGWFLALAGLYFLWLSRQPMPAGEVQGPPSPLPGGLGWEL